MTSQHWHFADNHSDLLRPQLSQRRPPPVCSPSLLSTTRTTTSGSYFDHSPDCDRQGETSKTQRQGRPVLAQRQSSYSKRHASFDTPREVPFPSQLSSDVRDRRASFSRSSSDSTVEAPSRPRSPSFAPQDVVYSAHPADNVPLPSSAGIRGEGTTAALNHLVSAPPMGSGSVDRREEAPHSAGDAHMMTYKCTSEGAGSPAVARSAAAEAYREQRNAGIWDSMHLRPELLASPPKPKARDIQPQAVDHRVSLPDAHSPYYPTNQERFEMYAPTPTRPSSSASLPLPSQMPFYALPSSNSVQQQSNAALPSVIEQEQSSFDPSLGTADPNAMDTSSMTSSSSFDPRLLQRRVSSPPLNSLAALFESADRHGRRNPRISAAGSTSTVSTVLSGSSQISSASSSLPPPTPPTVHTPPPPPLDGTCDEKSAVKEGKRQSAPYEPFLSHAPPPKDSYISVETTDVEYRLIVRLPGYGRDAIMLSTRRRRILHIAADSWEAGGGHFERRISFGYDADLGRVRAEFDGEHLRVLVPRKVIPITWTDGTQQEPMIQQ